jgi:hypothetical protein
MHRTMPQFDQTNNGRLGAGRFLTEKIEQRLVFGFKLVKYQVHRSSRRVNNIDRHWSGYDQSVYIFLLKIYAKGRAVGIIRRIAFNFQNSIANYAKFSRHLRNSSYIPGLPSQRGAFAGGVRAVYGIRGARFRLFNRATFCLVPALVL